MAEQAIREARAAGEVEATPCPVTPLGHGDGRYHFLSRVGELRNYRFNELGAPGLDDLFGGDPSWLCEQFPRVDDEGNRVSGYAVGRARAWLIERCTAAGMISLDRQLRGPGVWPGAGAHRGEIILHCGDVVRVGGEWQPAGCRIDGHIYPRAPALPRPAARPIDAAAARDLVGFIGSWPWTDLRDPIVVVGWLAAATVVGLLDWRPHVWISGKTGTGKTTLEMLIRDLLGEDWMVRVSSPTEAAVRHELGPAARPVTIDEIEPDEAGQRAREVAALVRVASRRGQAPVGRGGTGGVAQRFPMAGLFWFTSVLICPLAPQDRNRITVAALHQLPEDDQARERLEAGLARFRPMGPAIRARMLAAWPRFGATFGRYAAALAEAGHPARQIDQIGTLLACYDLLVGDDLPDSDTVADLAGQFPPDERIGAGGSASDAQECLDKLLSTAAESFWNGSSHRPVTIGQMIVRALAPGGDAAPLRPHGLNIRPHPAIGVKMLVIANKHEGLEAIFKGSKWRGGVWTQSLEDIPGACKPNTTVYFDGPRSKGLWLPLDAVPRAGEDELEVPAASGHGEGGLL